ncbi:MAG: glycerol-3-phosphate 1-O-acyltransferase PlsY [Candidatus Margulisbacteria bacterium]|nr:glycerol-3-phosphate 1-O-acyltransferase PlsY [Candidatus Margulisiibacteriota bacterium]
MIVISYAVGSVPYSLIFSRMFSHVDVRQAGTKNLGATNAMISGGIRAGFFTLVFDVAKGYGPVFLAQIWIGTPLALALAAVFAVVGHDFPFYLRFKGGKGVASSAGAFLAIEPLVVMICLPIWLGILLATRYFILSTVLTFLFIVPAAVILLRLDPAILAAAVAIGLLSLFQHRNDLKRIIEGKEPVIFKIR